MFSRTNISAIRAAVAIAVAATGVVTPAQAQIVYEDFDNVDGTSGVVVLTGSGFNNVDNWDNALVGENAFAGTVWNTHLQATAQGVTDGGLNGSGAGQMQISGVTFDLVNETFEMASGTGGPQFLTGDGVTPDLQSWTPGWDDALSEESAFAGAQDGAIIGDGEGATAQALLTGGHDGTKGGQISMTGVTVGPGSWYAGLMWRMNHFPGATPLFNPGFEEGWIDSWDWDTDVGWNIYPSTEFPHNGIFAAKLFGEYNVTATGQTSISGISQGISAAPGEEWQATAYAGHPVEDPMLGSNTLDMKIEFFDAGGALLAGGTEVELLNSGSTPGTWTMHTLSAVAPAGTAEARIAFVFTQEDDLHEGAAFIDDVGFKPLGATNVNLADYTLTARIKGTANGAAGETMGDYQLRIEDTDGNRRVFSGFTPSSWDIRGGALDTAPEADADGNPAAGVFNVNSAYYTVIAALDDEGSNRWGTGGTLAVDDLLLPSTDSTGSDWYAGLFWDDVIARLPSLEVVKLSAQVMGSVSNAPYELRLEANKLIDAGVDESVESATGVGGGWFLSDEEWDQEAQTDGSAYTTDWDSGITGMGAYGGIYNGKLWDLDPGTPEAGFIAQALDGGGHDGVGGDGGWGA
ncbi:MAG: hypothetical protein ACYS7M_15515, partial [Planctomycetota bacterium]